jgi:hypothetical protein
MEQAGQFVSSNDVLVTYVWSVLRKVRGRSGGGGKKNKYPPRIIQAINMRGRVCHQFIDAPMKSLTHPSIHRHIHQRTDTPINAQIRSSQFTRRP